MGKDDLFWRKARLAARLILRNRAGRVSARDRRLGAWIRADEGVSDRLIDQALAQLSAGKPHVPS